MDVLEPSIADLIGIGGEDNPHGCMNYAIVEVTGPHTGIVVESQSCHACWQVGHDDDYEFFTVGEEVDLREFTITEAEPKRFSRYVKFVATRAPLIFSEKSELS